MAVMIGTSTKGEPDEARGVALTSSGITDDLFDPEQDLVIRVKRKTLAQVLGSDIDVGESFYLECRKTGSAGRDGIRIVGRRWTRRGSDALVAAAVPSGATTSARGAQTRWRRRCRRHSNLPPFLERAQ